MADPTDLPALDRVRRALGREVDAVICEPRALRDLIARAHASVPEAREQPAAESPAPASEPAAPVEAPAVLAPPPEPAPIAAAPAPKPARSRARASAAATPADSVAQPGTLDQLLVAAAEEGAAELHLHATDRGLRVRARIDGRLVDRPCSVSPKAALDRLGALVGPPLDLDSGRPRVFVTGTTEATLGIAPCPGGWTATLALRTATPARSLADLGFTADAITRLGAILAGPPGVLVVAGHAGTGRTTTIHAALRTYDTESLNIVAACEHPVAGARNIGPAASHARALRPDVLVIDPAREECQARSAIESALAGALVLVVIDAPDAADAAVRFRELSGGPGSCASMLRGVLCLGMARKVCGACARVEPPTTGQRRRLGLADHETSFVRGAGCPRCRDSGTRGSAPVFELLGVDPELAAILPQADARAVREHALERGLIPMWRQGLDMARLGVISLDELEGLAPEHAAPTLALRRSA